ncbi:MAG TPA: zf-HC2 domain-containing protein [archaeon]|nr:zf-HC2 domain-containing protein [archaeon]
MKCPLDESLLVDYLEGELEATASSMVSEHLKSCPVCRTEYEALLEAREALRAMRESKTEEPPESFWQESLQAVAQATYRRRVDSSLGKVIKFPYLKPKFLAAAAVVMMALAGTLKWGLFTGRSVRSPETVVQAVSPANNIALEDSLYLLTRAIYQCDLAAMALESIGELEAGDTSGIPSAGMVFPVGRSVYEGLLDLKDNEIDNVMVLLASL